MRSRKGKRMLLAGIHSILNVLQYKKLEWREYRYVIQSVVASKALYCLNVAPFTDAELDASDRRIAGQLKKTLKLARSTSSHICYLPEADRGFALPSIKQRRDALLVKQAYRCLNDPGHLGKIFRTRLLDLKLAIGHTNNPLSKPISHRHLYTHEDIYQEFTCRIRLYSNYYDIRRDTTINDFCIRSQPYTVEYVCFVYDCVPSIFV
jgi:hypothetical protein